MKGKKLVIAVILALIVCLVLIPTCAFASEPEGDGTQPVGTSTGDVNLLGGSNVDDDNANGDITYFDTMQEAVDATGNDGEATMGDNTTESITVDNKEGITFYINLNGKTLTGKDNDESGTLTAVTVNSGNVTIYNGTIVGQVKVLNSAVVTFGWDLTINGNLCVKGEVENGTAKTPEANVYCTINSVNNYAIFTDKDDESGATINVADGANITSKNNAAIYLPSGNLNVNGEYVCSITGTTGIHMKGGKLNITNPNATITGTNGDAVKIEYATIQGFQSIDEIAISDGNFKSTNGSNVAQYALGTDTITHENFIKGGWFYNAQPDAKLLNADAPLANRNDGIYAVGESPIYDLAATANSGDVVTITAIPEDTYGTEVTIDDIDGIAGGVVIKNGTENTTIIINGVKLAPGESYTVPGNAPASPLNARYCVISGNNQQWTEGDLEFKLNSKDVVKVLIDGIEVEFTVAEDGTVTIAAAVIEALESGLHEIEFVYADGSCKTVFTVA